MPNNIEFAIYYKNICHLLILNVYRIWNIPYVTYGMASLISKLLWVCNYRKLKLLYTVYIRVYTCIYSIPTEVYVRWVKLKTIVHRKEFQNYTVLFYDDILLDSITVKIIQKVHFARSLFIDWTTGGPTLDILMSQSNTRTSHFFKFFQIINIVAISIKEMYLAPSHVSRRLFECDRRLEWVNHSPVGDKWVMTDPHEQLKFKINYPLSRIRHRKPATRGRMCSQN